MPGDATFDVGRIEATMTLDTDPFQAGLDEAVNRAVRARAEIDEALSTDADINVGVNTDRALSELAAFESLVNSSTVTLRVDLNTAAALADLAALDTLSKMSAGVGVRGPRGASNGTLAAGALGALFGTGGSGTASRLLWGETGGGFMSRLLSPLTLLTTMFSAGFGSVGSFAGFGPEHLAMTGLGLAGSATEGAMGGGLLALGSAGKDLIGGGSDMLASRTAASGVKSYMALAQAVATYGANSVQARAASNSLAAAMKGDSAAAKEAESGIATAAQTLEVQWRAASSGAQVQATRIMGQVLDLATDYAPRVAAAAESNLAVVNASLRPLFSWLEGPSGVGVFNSLENDFRTELPTAVNAFDEGIELLLRTMALAASYTGGFITKLDALLIRMNTPAGFDKWSAEVKKLIGDFHMWEALLAAVGHDLRSMFADDAGEPAAIITGLTSALQKLGRWEDSAAGKASILSVFDSHKGEILALADAMGQLGTSFGKIYLTAAPMLVDAVTAVLNSINPLLRLLVRNPFTAWLLGLTLIITRLGLLSRTLGLASTAASGFRAVMAAATGTSGVSAGAIGLPAWMTGRAAAAGGTAVAADAGETAASTGMFAGALGALSAAIPFAAAGVATLGAVYAAYRVASDGAAASAKKVDDQITAAKSGEILDNADSYLKVAGALQQLNIQASGPYSAASTTGKFAVAAQAEIAAANQITSSLVTLSSVTGQTQTRLQMIAQSAGVDLSRPLSQTATEMTALALFTHDTSTQFATLGQAWKDLNGPAATLQSQLQGLNLLFSTETPMTNYVQTTNSAKDAMSNLTSVVKTGASTQEDIQSAFIAAENALNSQVEAAKASGAPLTAQNQLYLTGYNNLVAMAGATTASKNALHALVENLITPAQFEAMNAGLNTSGAAFQGLTDKINGTAGALRNVGTLAGALAAAPAVTKILASGGLGIPNLSNLINPSLLPTGRTNNPGQQARDVRAVISPSQAPVMHTQLVVQGSVYGDQALVAKVTSLMDKRDEQLTRALAMH